MWRLTARACSACRLVKHELLRDSGKLRSFDSYDDLVKNTENMHTVFLSHQWLVRLLKSLGQ